MVPTSPFPSFNSTNISSTHENWLWNMLDIDTFEKFVLPFFRLFQNKSTALMLWTLENFISIILIFADFFFPHPNSPSQLSWYINIMWEEIAQQCLQTKKNISIYRRSICAINDLMSCSLVREGNVDNSIGRNIFHF